MKKKVNIKRYEGLTESQKIYANLRAMEEFKKPVALRCKPSTILDKIEF